jgi:hypothetical protein
MNYFCAFSFLKFNDFKKYISKNLYDIFFEQLSMKQKCPFTKVPPRVFPGIPMETISLSSTERTIPPYIPIVSFLYCPMFKFSIDYLIFQKEYKSYVITFIEETNSSLFQDIQFILSILSYDNICKEFYFLYDLKTHSVRKQKCEVTPEKFFELQKKIMFIKTIYYQIHKDPLDWSPKYFPIFSSSDEIIKNEKKRKHAQQVGELTLLNNIGEKARVKLHQKGIYTFFDSRLLQELGPKVAKKNRNILYINNHLEKKPKKEEWKYVDPLIYQDKRCNNLFQKRKEGKILYLDFEQDSTDSFVYLCGIIDSHMSKFVFWTDESETQLFEKLYNFLKTKSDHAIVYYHADLSYYKKLWKSYFDATHWMKVGEPSTSNWYDLKYVAQEFCSFRGAYTFSIKDIIKSYSSMNLCENPYETEDENTCTNGLESIFLFQEYRKTKQYLIKEKLIQYNINDCIVQKIILDDIFNHVENNTFCCSSFN